MKKCIIIGSGLGGLSCGCILAKNGYDVTILEQETQIGGCLQCFRRGGVVFDTGMHYIGSADKGQALDILLRYLGVADNITLDRLEPSGFDIISLKGEHYRIANGREGFINALSKRFPDSRKELERYYDLVMLVASSASMHSLSGKTDIDINTAYQLKSVNSVIESVISDPLLREVLAGIQMLYAGEKDRTPFSTHAFIMDFYNQSAFRIVGGSSKVADALAAKIESFGGKVLTRREVVKIECDDEKATAVMTNDGERFAADLVISAIHPSTTMKFVDSQLIRPAYRRRVNNLHNSISAFTVYLKFRKDTVPYMRNNLYYYQGETTWGSENYSEEVWPKSILYMHFCHESNPLYAQTGEIITYMRFDEVKKWLGTSVGHRGNDYEEFKHRKAETVIQALEKEVPGLKQSIEAYYTSTPLTYLDYTGVPEGAMYGVAKDVNAVGGGSITHKTRIPNLLLTGQNITCHGMLGVLVGSLMTCSDVIPVEEIYAQLKSEGQ